MKRRDFLKIAAALPIASAAPAIAIDDAPMLTESALEQAIIEIGQITEERGLKIATQPRYMHIQYGLGIAITKDG